ncbi:hypothetical protein B0A50_04239 [Salinomyces thailandicus]|uniref:Uncharacterized protein n=1 Tax=Salinomyces thailandicus TaxID=706561 RepID=A0A4U0TWK2_9PEZI|nr:hypothetical protein B0A50_04239 [Salinomyces thailandica]
MADVRSMLRAERASRRVTHPNASYTSDGRLLCNICDLMVKSEAAWQGHLHSTGHTLRLNRAKDAAAARGQDTAGKKRKAESQDSSANEETKRARPSNPTSSIVDLAAGENNSGQAGTTKSGPAPAPVTKPSEDAEPPPAQLPPEPPADEADAAELEAFMQEMADMDQPAQSSTALNAEATISAAPLTAEELAAQAREEQSAQRGKRDTELEDEREDAAQALQEEFEEMESLEQRVRKLREKREALRKGSMENGSRAEVAGAVEGDRVVNGQPIIDEEVEDEDEDEEFDDWNFGSR